MNLDTITFYFTQYGAIAIFVIVLLEYMNLPGFPDHYAAFGHMGRQRKYQLFLGHVDHAGGGRAWKLDLVFSRTDRR